MQVHNRWALLLIGVLLSSACAQTGLQQSSTVAQPSTGERVSNVAPKTLVLALEEEPTDSFLGSIAGGASTIAGNLKLAVHQTLAHYDDQGGLYPMLAAELPSQENGSWVVRPEGTMQTTYRLRPNVTWHDGTPLTSRDFLFGWTVTRDPDVPMRNRGLARQVERIDVPDDLTLIIEWSGTYPFAAAIVEDEIGPMPQHLLEPTYQESKERFAQLAYWTREFIGVGPYRLAEWQPGSHLTLKAYDRFSAGAAKIDTLVFRFIPDAQTAVANLLAGSVDGAIPRSLDFSDVMLVKYEWERAGRRPVAIVQPTHWRILEPQLRGDLVSPREILDIRVRRALLLAIDRQALVDTLLAGTIPISQTFIPPDDPKWGWVRDVVVQYPYDPRQAIELLDQAGWKRGPDRTIVDASGQHVTIPIATSAGAQAEQEASIIAANWRDLGLAVDQQVRTAAESRDNRLTSIFAGFSTSSGPLTFAHLTTRLSTANCPSDSNRWTGSNHGCYRNPDLDRALVGLQTAIAPNQQRELYRTFARIQTEDLPVFPLYFNPQAFIFRDGISGVKGDTKPRTSMSWNVREWDIQGS